MHAQCMLGTEAALRSMREVLGAPSMMLSRCLLLTVITWFIAQTQLATYGHMFVMACLSGEESMQYQKGAHQHLDASHRHGLNARWHCLYTSDTALQKEYWPFYLVRLRAHSCSST